MRIGGGAPSSRLVIIALCAVLCPLGFLPVEALRADPAAYLDSLPPVEVPDGWIKHPEFKSPFSVMVPLSLPEFAGNEDMDKQLSAMLDNAAKTKTFSRLRLLRKDDQPLADALTDTANMIEQFYQTQSQSLYGGSGNMWMAVDPEAFQALETCVHSDHGEVTMKISKDGKEEDLAVAKMDPNNPRIRAYCLQKLKADPATFVHQQTALWGTSTLIDKYFDKGGPAMVRNYAQDMRYKNWGFERIPAPSLSARKKDLEEGLVTTTVGKDCEKDSIPEQIKWSGSDLDTLAFPIDPDQYAAAYKNTKLCPLLKTALAEIAVSREAALVDQLLLTAATLPGIAEREKAALKEQREVLRGGLGRWDAGHGSFWNPSARRDLEIIELAEAERDREFRRLMLQGLLLNWDQLKSRQAP